METMRYTIQCVNMLFDILYSNGIFLPANDALQAQECAMRVCVFLYWFSFIFFNLTVWDFATSWILKGEKIDT